MRKQTMEWVGKAEGDYALARRLVGERSRVYDQIAFLCQQAVEKYLKAMMHHSRLRIPKTHDIHGLVGVLLPVDKTLGFLQRGTKTLSKYAVEYRYPGKHTTQRQAQL